MLKNNSNYYFNLLVIVIIISVYLVFNYTYRTSILIGFILAVLTYPIYSWLKSKLPSFLTNWKSSISAFVTMIFVSVILFSVLNFITIQLVREVPKVANSTYQTIQDLPNNTGFVNSLARYGIDREAIESGVKSINQSLKPDGGNGNTKEMFSEQNINKVLDIGQQVFSILFEQITYLILLVLAWFNGLVFGRRWLNLLLDLLPFTDQESVDIKKDLRVGIRNVIYANLLSGIIHTAICFVIMVIFQIPNIFIISVVIFLIGFLPASPSELGYAIPIAIIFTTNPIAGILLSIFAEAVILWVNYVFLPKVILEGSEGNPLFIVTSVLAAIPIFGIMGFIIGPVIMIFINTLGQILVHRIKGKSIETTI